MYESVTTYEKLLFEMTKWRTDGRTPGSSNKLARYLISIVIQIIITADGITVN